MGDLQYILNKYFVNLFKPNMSNVVVVSTSSKVKDIQKGFEQLGFTIKQTTLNNITISGIQ